MANRYAVKSGNWSDTTVWDGGTLPGAGDVVRPNTYTVTIDQDITVGTLRNDASSPAVASGSFVISTNRVVNAEIVGSGTTNGMVTISAAVTVTINGNITSNSSFKPFVVSAGATVTVNGNVTTTGVAVAMELTAANTSVTVNGNITSGSGSAGYGISATAANAYIAVNGNVQSGTGTSQAIYITSGGSIVVRGDITASATAAAVLVANGNATVTVDKPNAVISAVGAFAAILFTSYAGSSATIQLGSVVISTGSLGPIPLQGPTRIITGAQPIFTFKDTTSPTPATYTLSRLGSSNPAPTNVRAGTVYADNITGTLAVPSPASVAYGVPTDATTGTATLNLQTVASLVGQQIAAATSS